MQGFSNLQWKQIKEKPVEAWNTIKEWRGPQKGATLDDLADEVIGEFGAFLLEGSFNPFAYTRAMMERALKDHLIVTFAYRFYCDNLRPKELKEYGRILFPNTNLFNCEDNYIGVDQKTEKSMFIKDNRNAVKALLEMERETIALCEKRGAEDIAYKENEMLLAPNWQFTLALAKRRTYNLFKVHQATSGKNNKNTTLFSFEHTSYSISRLM